MQILGKWENFYRHLEEIGKSQNVTYIMILGVYHITLLHILDNNTARFSHDKYDLTSYILTMN